MNEIERRSYLDAMGVAVFYLKAPIAHAKSSPSYLIPDEPLLVEFESALELPPTSRTFGADSGQNTENTRSELAKIRQELKSPAVVKPTVSAKPLKTLAKEVPAVPARQEPRIARRAADDAQTQSSALRFKLNYYVINGTTAIVDEQPYVQAGLPDRDRLDLLRNILAALEVDYSHCDFQAETIAWPLETEMEFDESPDKAAEQMLRGFIAQKLRSHGFKHLLVFAGSLETLFDENRSSIASEFSMTITSSLSAMLAYPDLKRQVWQQLKPLIPLLAATSR
jgi:hypothetical protein